MKYRSLLRLKRLNIPKLFPRPKSNLRLQGILQQAPSDLLQNGRCECVSADNFDFPVVCAGQPDMQRESM